MDYSEERKYIIDFLIGNPSRARQRRRKKELKKKQNGDSISIDLKRMNELSLTRIARTPTHRRSDDRSTHSPFSVVTVAVAATRTSSDLTVAERSQSKPSSSSQRVAQ